MRDRRDIILEGLNREGCGLEIGPSHSPIAPKAEGFKVEIVDHLDAAGLREKYKDHHVDLERIEEVDYVWSGQPLSELIGKTNAYDWIIASHVIEHSPDLVSFLNDCSALLKPNGTLSLAIPDKRYCFDHLRPVSSLSQIIDHHVDRRSRPSPGCVAEHTLYAISKGGKIGWGPEQQGHVEFIHSVEETKRELNLAMETKAYKDVHSWCFTPDSFRALVHQLESLGLCQLFIEDWRPTQGCEFFVSLKRRISGPRETKSIDRFPGATPLDEFVEKTDRAVENDPLDRAFQQNAVDLFSGEWSCTFPPTAGVETGGFAATFDDDRLKWANQHIHFRGKSVLELGPLEGLHTYFLEQLGAHSILAIEASERAYLRCLVAKEILKLQRSAFLKADFTAYLRTTQRRFDICLACGVLYHLLDPVQTIHCIGERSDSVFIWTHYYDPSLISELPHIRERFAEESSSLIDGIRYRHFRYSYQSDKSLKAYCGGTAQSAHWLDLDSLRAAVTSAGFSILAEKLEAHPNGPAAWICASKQ